jgi:hypothetical protein
MNDDTEAAAFKIFTVCMGVCLIALGVLGILDSWVLERYFKATCCIIAIDSGLDQ